jgi:predicted permease
MSTLLFALGAFLAYVLCAKAFAYVWDRMSLSWAHAAVLALLYMIVSVGFEASPLSSISVGATSLSTLLVLPTVFAVGAWYLKGRLLLKSGEGAGVGVRMGVTIAPLLLVAVVGVVLVLVQAR